MQLAYFGFFGTPAKLFLEDKLPERCELYEREWDVRRRPARPSGPG